MFSILICGTTQNSDHFPSRPCFGVEGFINITRVEYVEQGSKLTGTVPPESGLFLNATSFLLTNNTEVTGTIPRVLGTLTKYVS
jgi:hypothetical protein